MSLPVKKTLGCGTQSAAKFDSNGMEKSNYFKTCFACHGRHVAVLNRQSPNTIDAIIIFSDGMVTDVQVSSSIMRNVIWISI
jgi:hypothetical protein